MNKKLLLIIPGILLLFFISIAGRLLVLDEQPQTADVIIVLAGDLGARTERGAALWREGYAPYLMVSGGTVYHNTNIGQLMADHAVEMGVPRPSVLVEPHAHTTYQNAVDCRELMRQYNFHSAIVVSSNYHMRRVKYTFQKVFGNDGRLTFCSVNEPDFIPEHWWSDNPGRLIVITEYLKLVGYFFGQQS